jgi:hypothetical protein|tara:strand:- start:26 stop:133 length:108 start_codon:yes stop_codon:yes gene_type:complete
MMPELSNGIAVPCSAHYPSVEAKVKTDLANELSRH